MALKLYGTIKSTCTQRVMAIVKELGIDVEIVPVDFAKQEHKSKEYIETKQPFGVVPVLDDDGFILYESRAIARYLVAKYGKGSTLVPGPTSGLQAMAIFGQASSVEVSNFDPYAYSIAREKFFKPVFFGLPGDEAKAAEATKTLEEKMQGYEVILKKQKYLAGNELTIVDLFHLPYGSIITDVVGVTALTSDATPHVAKWWKEISSRQAWKDVQADVKAATSA